MTNTQPQLTLVTDAISASMENSLVAARLVRWNEDSRISATNNFKFVERVPSRFNLRRTTGEVADVSTRQNSNAGAEVFALNETITIDRDWNDFAHVQDEDQALRDMYLDQMGMNTGEDVDADILSTLMLAGCNWTGTPGTAVDDIEALMDGFVKLKREGVPNAELFAVLDYSALPKLAKYLLETVTAASKEQSSLLGTVAPQDGALQSIGGLKILFTQQNPSFTVGTRAASGAAQVDGNSQEVNYSAVHQSTTTNGRFLTQTLAVDNMTAGKTIKDGEVFTIAGVNAWDPRKGASQGILRQFRVVGDYTSDSNGEIAAMRIFPAIITGDGSTKTGDGGANNANRTVEDAPSDGDAITFLGTASTSYPINAIVAKSAVRVLSRALEDLPSGENAQRKAKGVPLTLRSHRYSAGDTGNTAVRFDAAYETNIEAWGRFKVVRING